MLTQKLNDAINDQINAEMYSAYLYLSMAAWFEAENLPGFANWMRVQVQEEQFHAMRFFGYVHNRNGRVILAPIDGPPTSWESALDVFKATLEHEEYVTSRINKIMDMAIAESDHALKSHLQWFVDEQVEEESNANTILGKLRLAQGSPQAMLMLDTEMAARVFTAPTTAGTVNPI